MLIFSVLRSRVSSSKSKKYFVLSMKRFRVSDIQCHKRIQPEIEKSKQFFWSSPESTGGRPHAQFFRSSPENTCGRPHVFTRVRVGGCTFSREYGCCSFSLQSSVFSLQSSVLSLQSSVLSLQSSVFSLQSSVFSLQSSVFSLQL